MTTKKKTLYFIKTKLNDELLKHFFLLRKRKELDDHINLMTI